MNSSRTLSVSSKSRLPSLVSLGGDLPIGHSEEVRRRELLRVPDDDQLVPAEDRPDRILRRELGGLVEDHEIEVGTDPSISCATVMGTHHETAFDGPMAAPASRR